MPEAQQRCGTCRWLHVPPDKDGKSRVRVSNIYACNFVIEWPQTWPASIPKISVYGLHGMKRFMAGDQGITCPCWEARPK